MRSLIDEWIQTTGEDSPSIIVEITEVRGSTPRDTGTFMLVNQQSTLGTIGGGKLEWLAIEKARELLQTESNDVEFRFALGPELGQCCGGNVTLAMHRAIPDRLEIIRQRDLDRQLSWKQVFLFGAGHVGKAIAKALAPLPYRLRWIDERQSEFPKGTDGTVAADPVKLVDEAEPGTNYLVLTHDHLLDFRICEAVLARGDFAYLGLIGSKSKRARFERGFGELGLDYSRLTCPIGSPEILDKRPEVIAALVAAELLHANNNEQNA